MSTVRLTLALGLLLVPSATASSGALAPSRPPGGTAAGERPVKVVWGQKKFEAQEPPESLAEPTKGAIEFWRPWAHSADYSMQLTPDERVLYIHPRRRGGVKREMVLVRKTVELFDSVLPVPPGRAEAAAAAAAAKADAEPEHPEGWVGWEYTWGSLPALETETCVLLVAANPSDYTSMLDFLQTKHEYLIPWVDESRGLFGFTLEQPLAACWVEQVPGQEEWSPDGELVHRLFRLLVLRDFGRQPYWLQVAMGNWAELELNDAAYCFPYRDEWVGVGEHTGWDVELKNAFKKRKWRQDPLGIEEFAGWHRGEWSTEAAHKSWGVFTYLARYEPERLPAVLEGLRILREEQERTDFPDGTWERKRDFEVSAEDQLRVLQTEVFEAILEEFHESFAKAKKYKRPKQ